MPDRMNSLIFLNTYEFFQNFITILKFSKIFKTIAIRMTRKLLESNVESENDNISKIRKRFDLSKQ